MDGGDQSVVVAADVEHSDGSSAFYPGGIGMREMPAQLLQVFPLTCGRQFQPPDKAPRGGWIAFLKNPNLAGLHDFHGYIMYPKAREIKNTPHEKKWWVSRAGDFHPSALSEPDGNLSIHPAPIIL